MRRLFARFRAEPAPRLSAGYLPVMTTSLGVLALAAWLGVAGQASGEAPAKADSIAVISSVASVIDADTLDIRGESIRLVGVDAPESGQKRLSADHDFVRCGSIVANALDAWIDRNPVTCNIEGKDRYSACSAGAMCAAKASRNGSSRTATPSPIAAIPPSTFLPN